MKTSPLFLSSTSGCSDFRAALCKRILILFFCLSGLAAHGDFYSVSWFSEDFLLSDTSVPPTNPISIADGISGGQVLYALYYTPSSGGQALAATPSFGAGPLTWSGLLGNPGGDDRLVLVARDNEKLGSNNNQFTQDYQGAALGNLATSQTGYFYSVAFQYNDSAVNLADATTWNALIPSGIKAYISPTTAITATAIGDIPPLGEVSASLGGTWVGGGADGSAVAQTVMIPEPSMVALVLLGLLLLGKRFRTAFSRT